MADSVEKPRIQLEGQRLLFSVERISTCYAGRLAMSLVGLEASLLT
jgi:hypothetical protein